jgi:hypothetical protein
MRRFLVLTVALAVVAVGCGSDDAATSDDEVPTSVTAAHIELGSGDGDEARVVLAGDSVMTTLSPPLRAALGPAGDGARFTLYPQFPLDSADVVESAERVVGDAELVVVLMGVWQGATLSGGLIPELDADRPDLQQAFRERFVQPWLQAVTDAGAKVIWVGMTRTSEPLESIGIGQLNRTFQEAVAAFPEDATYVDAGRILADDAGRYQPVVTEGGEEVRLQGTDGHHLCPEGAARIADAIIPRLPADLQAEADPDFRDHGDWQVDDFLEAQDWYDLGTLCP